MTPPQQVPLRDVPVGACVLHLSAVGVVRPGNILELFDQPECGSEFAPDTLVTPLVGSEPRLLTDADIGAWVHVVDWEQHSLPQPTFLVARHLRDGGYVDADGWEVAPDWPVWIVQPAPARQDREEVGSAEARWRVMGRETDNGWSVVDTVSSGGFAGWTDRKRADALAVLLNEHAPDGLPGNSAQRCQRCHVAEHVTLGKTRLYLVTCVTCLQTAERHPTWEDDPVRFIGRLVGGGWSRRGEEAHDTFARELVAMVALVEAHREEFDDAVAGLTHTTDLSERRRLRKARRA